METPTCLATKVVFLLTSFYFHSSWFRNKSSNAVCLLATVSNRIVPDPGSWLIIKLEADSQDLSDTRDVCLPSKIAPIATSRLSD